MACFCDNVSTGFFCFLGASTFRMGFFANISCSSAKLKIRFSVLYWWCRVLLSYCFLALEAETTFHLQRSQNHHTVSPAGACRPGPPLWPVAPFRIPPLLPVPMRPSHLFSACVTGKADREGEGDNLAVLLFFSDTSH